MPNDDSSFTGEYRTFASVDKIVVSNTSMEIFLVIPDQAHIHNSQDDTNERPMHCMLVTLLPTDRSGGALLRLMDSLHLQERNFLVIELGWTII